MLGTPLWVQDELGLAPKAWGRGCPLQEAGDWLAPQQEIDGQWQGVPSTNPLARAGQLLTEAGGWGWDSAEAPET